MKLVARFLILSLLFLLNGAPSAEEIKVKDYSGNTIILPSPAQRIVALSPHAVENVFAAGAGDLLVGRVEYADYPDVAKQLPIVGGFAFVNIEALLALKPDLVIAWGSGNHRDTIAQIRALNIAVYVDEPQSLNDIATSLRAIGVLSGRQASAERAAQAYLRDLRQLEQRYRHRRILSVLYQIWHSPIQTVNDQHIISHVIALCGGNNVFGDAVPEAPVINRETVIDRNPDVIIASGADEKRPAWLDNWQAWPTLTAVKNEFVFFVPPDYLQRHTPRILIGAQQVCEQLQSVRNKGQ